MQRSMIHRLRHNYNHFHRPHTAQSQDHDRTARLLRREGATDSSDRAERNEEITAKRFAYSFVHHDAACKHKRTYIKYTVQAAINLSVT